MDLYSMPAIHSLLVHLSSADFETRSNAESSMREAINNHKSSFIIALINYLLSPIENHRHDRKLACILLRKIFVDGEGLTPEEKENSSCFQLLDAQGQNDVKAGLFHVISCEKNDSIAFIICEIIADLLCYSMETNAWPEMLHFMYSNLQSMDVNNRCVGFALLGMIADTYMESFMENPSIIQVMVATLGTGLQFVPGTEGRKLFRYCLVSLTSILTSLSRESQLENFLVLLPSLFATFNTIMVEYVSNGCNESDEIIAMIESMIEITEERVYFYEAQLGFVFDNVMSLVENINVSCQFRRMLIELLTSICVNAPKQTRKLKGPENEKYYFIQRLFPICLQFMAMVPEDANWESRESLEGTGIEDDADDFDPENTLNSDVGESALDRMTQALGLRSTYTVVSGQVLSLLQQNDWKYHYTALRYLGNYLEVTAKIDRKDERIHHHNEVMATLSKYLKPGIHPRVKYVGFFALSQFLVYHGSFLPQSHLGTLLTIILSNASSASNPAPRIRRNVIGCLINIIDCAPASFIEPKVGDILNVVIQTLSDGPRIVQEFCVSVITSLAETLRDDQMAAYYDALMPILKSLLIFAQNSGLETLYGQTLECCAVLGEASGKAKFISDATDMMTSLVAIQNQISEGSDVRKYLLKAWVRVARCLGSDFLPFLPLVMDNLLAAITQDVTNGTADVNLEDIDEDRSDIDVIETEKGWISVRTSAVEEQASACQLMVLIIEKLQEHFYSYVESTVKAMIPLLSSPHDDVRSYCMVVIPELIRTTAKATVPDRSVLITFTDYVMGQLVQAIEKESIIELVMTGLQALRQTILYSCTNWALLLSSGGQLMTEPPTLTPANSLTFLNAAQMESLTKCTQVVLRESIQRRAVMRAEAQISGGADDDDAADEQALLTESMELHYIIADLLGSILRTHGEQYFPVFSAHYLDIVHDLSQAYCLKEDRQFALYVICDVLEFALTKTTAITFFASELPAVIETAHSCEHSGPRQAASYAIGVAAEKFSQEFVPFVLEALAALSHSINMGEQPGEPRGHCTDNSVLAVGIILESMYDLGIVLDYDNIWDHWLGYLPLKHDVEEGKRVIAQLLRLLRHRQPAFSTHERLVQSVFVLLQTFESELSNEQLDMEISDIVMTLLHSTAIADAVNRGLVRSDAALRVALDKILTGSQTSTSPGPSAPIHDVLFRM